MVTRRPRHLRRRPREEAVSPLPSELETPPVTKMNLLTPPAERRRSEERRLSLRMIGAPFQDNRRHLWMWRTQVWGRAWVGGGWRVVHSTEAAVGVSVGAVGGCGRWV